MNSLAAAVIATVLAGSNEPMMTGNTGDLTYAYEIQLPAARGLVQPSFALTYSSANNRNIGYGLGWSPSVSYIELDDRASLLKVPRARYRFASGDSSSVLVEVSAGQYRAAIEQAYVSYVFDGATWTATDGRGITYRYQRQGPSGCQRWYLSQIVDLDQNYVTFAYNPEGDSCSATVDIIEYNHFVAGSTGPVGLSGPAATRVDFAYDVSEHLGVEADGGTLIAHAQRLHSIKVMAWSAGGYVTEASYLMQYEYAPDTSTSLLKSVTKYGGDFEQALPPTEFTYTAGEYALATETGVIGASDPDCTEHSCILSWFGYYVDFDGDGLPDLTRDDEHGWSGGWARNVTTPGSGTLEFSPWANIPGAVGTYRLLDFDGDGLQDLVAARTTACDDPAQLEVRLGTVVGGGFQFAPPVCANAYSPHLDYYTLWQLQFFWQPWEDFKSPIEGYDIFLRDVDGDGVVDYTMRLDRDASCAPDCPAYVYHGAVDRSVTPPSIWFGPRVTSSTAIASGGHEPMYDFNGDGLDDVVSPRNDLWKVWLNGGNGFQAAPGVVAHPYLRNLSDHPTFEVTSYHCPPNTIADNLTVTRGALIDVNADGLSDYVYRAQTASGAKWYVSWNTGRGFSTQEGGAPGVYPRETRTRNILCEDPEEIFLYWYDYESGNNVQFLDLNADGVPDRVSRTGTGGWKFSAGSLNGGTVWRTNILSGIRTPQGAQYSITYSPASKFGALESRPLVKKIEVRGVELPTDSITEFWYEGPARHPAWDDPQRIDPAGFGTTYSRKSATGLITRATWEVSSAVRAGTLKSMDAGYAATAGSESSPPAAVYVTQQSVTFATKRLGVGATDCLSTEPGPWDYPVANIPIHEKRYLPWREGDATEAASTRTISCSDIDDFGNVKEERTDPDVNVPGDGAIVRRTFGWGSCNVCLRDENVYAESSPTISLSNSTHMYERGHLTLSFSWTGDPCSEALTNLVSSTYQGNGLLERTRIGTVETIYRYDLVQLHRVQETTAEDGSARALIVRRNFDAFGRVAMESRPFVSNMGAPFVAGGTVPIAEPPKYSRYFYYDALGRATVTARYPATASDYVDVLSVNEYLDFEPNAERPSALLSYEFVDPVTFARGPVPPQVAAAAQITYAFADGLGRAIQQRQRLGPAAQGGANGTVLGGYRVTGTVVYDGAGRARASVDPYYSWSSGYSRADIPAASAMGTVTTFDTVGRETCSVRRPFPGYIPDAGGVCKTVNTDDASYRLATVTRYGSTVLDGVAYNYIETVPPVLSVDDTARGTRKLLDGSGREVATIDAADNLVRSIRDAAGRITQVQRVARKDGAPFAAPIIVMTTWNGGGQPVETIDPSSGMRRRCYEASGRLRKEEIEGTDGSLQGFLDRKYLDLGRLTEVSQHTYEVENGISMEVVRVVGAFAYDDPQGLMSLAHNAQADGTATTTIRYEYDDHGRLRTKQQWFADGAPPRAGAIGPVTETWEYSGNGRLKARSVESAYSAPLRYEFTYDSAGQLVAIADGSTGGPSLIWHAGGTPQDLGGYYDATGKLGTILVDNGLVRTTRSYSPFSGMLAADVKQFTSGPMADLYRVDNIVYRGANVSSFNDASNGTLYTYDYGASAQLTTARAIPSVGAPPALMQMFDQTYSFREDETGAQCGSGIGPSFTNLQLVTHGSCAAPNDREWYAYDGDLLWMTVKESETASPSSHPETSFAYDLENRLVAVSAGGTAGEKLWYGPSGEILMRQVGDTVVYFAGDGATLTATLLAGCLDAGCAIVPDTLTFDAHVVLGSTRIASIRSRVVSGSAQVTQTLYYYRDRLGSIVATSLGGGAAGVRLRYTPYGALQMVDGVGSQDTDCRLHPACPDIGYAGALRLTGNLVYLKARVYDAQLRRFLTPDTVDLLRYTYVSGDPANYVDPTGRMRKHPLQPAFSFVGAEASWADFGAPVSSLGAPWMTLTWGASQRTELLIVFTENGTTYNIAYTPQRWATMQSMKAANFSLLVAARQVTADQPAIGGPYAVAPFLIAAVVSGGVVAGIDALYQCSTGEGRVDWMRSLKRGGIVAAAVLTGAGFTAAGLNPVIANAAAGALGGGGDSYVMTGEVSARGVIAGGIGGGLGGAASWAVTSAGARAVYTAPTHMARQSAYFDALIGPEAAAAAYAAGGP